MKTVLAISAAFMVGFALAYKRKAIYKLFTTKQRGVEERSPLFNVDLTREPDFTNTEPTEAESTAESIVAEEAVDTPNASQVFEWRTTNSADCGIYKVYMTIFVLNLIGSK